MFSQSAFARTGQNLKEKYKDPQHFLTTKDAKLTPQQMLEVDEKQLKLAKNQELMTGIRVRFTEEGPDRTIDFQTKYPKTETIEGISAQQSILELREAIAKRERMPVDNVNLILVGTQASLADKVCIKDCYVDWMGLGFEDWPPKFISRPKLKGWEIFVDVPASRDTSVWDNGRMQNYFDRRLIFDVEDSTTVSAVKALITQKIGIPAKQQTLTAHIRDTLENMGDYIELENDKTLGDYDLQRRCVCIKFSKRQFDENGDYIFDDAYWDNEGYHAQPANTWIPQDSLCDRSRPDASATDPTQPTSIVSDRRQKEVADKEKAAG